MTEIEHYVNECKYIIRYMDKDGMEMILIDILNLTGIIFDKEAYDIIAWYEIINKYQHAITIYHEDNLVGLIVTVENKNTFGEDHQDKIGNSMSYILIICIHEKHRNKGLATLLLKLLEQKLTPSLSQFNIILDVDKNNNNAIDLYIKNDYKIIKELDSEQYIMVKNRIL